MDPKDLNARCVELFQHPRVKLCMWHPRMFWDVGKRQNPTPEELTTPKVDLNELEVLLASAAQESPQCLSAVNERSPGRGDFILRQARTGSRPLLRPPQ